MIPGGLTRLVQPADVSWNKPFKEAYKELYSQWMVSGEKSYTPAGNVRAPSKLLCLRWVKEAWSKVSKEVIVKSFRVCGISVSIDGKEDDEIHCVKNGEVAMDARAAIQEKTQTLHMPTDCDACTDSSNEDGDPFAGLTDDEEELENNEICVEDV